MTGSLTSGGRPDSSHLWVWHRFCQPCALLGLVLVSGVLCWRHDPGYPGRLDIDRSGDRKIHA